MFILKKVSHFLFLPEAFLFINFERTCCITTLPIEPPNGIAAPPRFLLPPNGIAAPPLRLFLAICKCWSACISTSSNSFFSA